VVQYASTPNYGFTSGPPRDQRPHLRAVFPEQTCVARRIWGVKVALRSTDAKRTGSVGERQGCCPIWLVRHPERPTTVVLLRLFFSFHFHPHSSHKGKTSVFTEYIRRLNVLSRHRLSTLFRSWDIVKKMADVTTTFEASPTSEGEAFNGTLRSLAKIRDAVR
jgi:hypothetical protein